MVIKAVRYLLERHYSNFSDGAFLLDLQEAESLQDIVAKFSKELQLSSTNSETLAREMNKRKMLVVITNCPFILTENDLHSVTTDFFKEMITKNNNLQLILITENCSKRQRSAL